MSRTGLVDELSCRRSALSTKRPVDEEALPANADVNNLVVDEWVVDETAVDEMSVTHHIYPPT